MIKPEFSRLTFTIATEASEGLGISKSAVDMYIRVCVCRRRYFNNPHLYNAKAHLSKLTSSGIYFTGVSSLETKWLTRVEISDRVDFVGTIS